MTEFECDAVLFDLDGVLLDSSACIERHWRQWAESHDLEFNTLLQFMHGRPTVETIRLAAPHLPAEEEAARINEGEAIATDGVHAVKGAAPLVSLLPASRV